MKNADKKATRRRRRVEPSGVDPEAGRPLNPPRCAGARAYITRGARIAGVARRRPRAPESAAHNNPHPTSATTGPFARACVRTRDAACAMARCAVSALSTCALLGETEVTQTTRRRAREEAGGDHQHHHHHHHPRACVRADLRTRAPIERSDPASRDVAQLARAASPRDRTRLGRTCGRRKGRAPCHCHEP